MSMVIQTALKDWSDGIQKRLAAEYAHSRTILDHNVMLGAIREAVVRNVLREFLPNSTEVGTGQIIDTTGNKSKQIDIVIARADTPSFRFGGGYSAFLLESTFAAIEIKSMLYEKALVEGLDNLRSVKELEFSLHAKGHGSSVFEDGFAWVSNSGGLAEIEKRLSKPDFHNSVRCPEHIWPILPFVRLWLHWEAGHFRHPDCIAAIKDISGATYLDIFTHLLSVELGGVEGVKALCEEFPKASKLKKQFFQRLHETWLFDNIPPTTVMFAYNGFQSIKNLVAAVRDWFETARSSTTWAELPRIIMNDRLMMFRHYNTYHCVETSHPVTFFVMAICDSIMMDKCVPIWGGSAFLGRYFDLDAAFSESHPKDSPSYLIWEIPLTSESSGKVVKGATEEVVFA